MLRRKAQEALERGEPIPDIPGINEALEDKELTAELDRLEKKNRALKLGVEETGPVQRKSKSDA